MMMETRNLASGALFWNCKYVSVLVCVCVFFGWMCLHIVVYERLSANFPKQKKKERERVILPSPSSKICCFDFMASSTAIPSLDMFFVVVVIPHSFFASFIFAFCRSQCRVRVSFFFFYLLFSLSIHSCFQELPQQLFVWIHSSDIDIDIGIVCC